MFLTKMFNFAILSTKVTLSNLLWSYKIAAINGLKMCLKNDGINTQLEEHTKQKHQ